MIIPLPLLALLKKSDLAWYRTDEIIRFVGKRTVYTRDEIEANPKPLMSYSSGTISI